MSIFIINENYQMPLHNHPQMNGILKVLSGKLEAQSYTKIETDTKDEIIVRAEEPKILDSRSDSVVLHPHECNYHELTALDGQPAAFFDILSPPYSDMDDSSENARHCSFFKKIMLDSSGRIKLIDIPCPDHYYCDSYDFEQPDFMR
jgi:cysteamine dioxygenase